MIKGQGKIAVGDKYHRLTATEFLYTTPKFHAMWRWQCDCGRTCELFAHVVRSGNNHSCGCLLAEGKNRQSHGMRRTPEYNTWCHIKSRCYNPKNTHFKYYGGRGIIMCPEWLNSFEQFIADMGLRPGNNYSIDRINNDGNYEPANCRWTTAHEQHRNMSTNHYLMFHGEVTLLADAARELNIKAERLKYLLLSGYSIEEIERRVAAKECFRKGRPARRVTLEYGQVFVGRPIYLKDIRRQQCLQSQ